jgi:hypothetical protein
MQWDLNALIAVVVVLVPVALGAPAVLVLVPPPMTLTPATLPGRVQFAAFVVGLGAVAAMFPNGFVKLMIGMSDAALAPVIILGVNSRDGSENENGCEYRPCQQRCRRGRKLVRTIHW